MIIQIAWRNIWRNKIRSAVVITAMCLGLFSAIYSTALFKGMTDQRIKSGIESEVAHIQMHHPDFLVNRDVKKLIPDAGGIINSIQTREDVKGVSLRLIINAMLASAETGTGVQLTGISPENEGKVSNINEKLLEGSYFEESFRNPIVIGKKLATRLNVKLKSKIVVTFQDVNGNIVRAAFRVCGIYKLDNSAFEEMMAYVQESDLVSLYGFTEGQAHEIAILLNSSDAVPAFTDNLRKEFTAVESLPWNEISPELGYLVTAMDQYMYIFVIVILLALGFGIVNTMLMAVLERIKEIGMLMAIGMNKARIFSMIMLETIFLVMVGGSIGIVFGYMLATYNETHPLEFPQYAQGFEAMGYSAKTYASAEPFMIVNISLLVLATGIIASIYPARKALKLNPAETLRTE